MSDEVRREYHERLWRFSLADQIRQLGCYWDVREPGLGYELEGDEALSAALSCHMGHGGGVGRRGLTNVY